MSASRSQSVKFDLNALTPQPRRPSARRLVKLAMALAFGCAVSTAFPSPAHAGIGIKVRPLGNSTEAIHASGEGRCFYVVFVDGKEWGTMVTGCMGGAQAGQTAYRIDV
jgi:hypothetical protein